MSRRWAAAAVVMAACGTQGGVLVEISQSPQIGKDIDTLRVFVGTPDDTIQGFSGIALPEDVITLSEPLSERSHSIELVGGEGLPTDTTVRIAVVGKSGGEVVGLGVRDIPGIPRDVVLRYDLVLGPSSDLVMTDSGCLLLPDGTVVVSFDDRDCDEYTRAQGDCDDLDPQVHPDAYDACAGGSFQIDDDCNGTPDDGDFDGDGADCQRDCDDMNPERTPGNLEDCDGGVDNDCDFAVDEGEPEVCGDGIDNDCDPNTADMSPEEICGDGADNDCDGNIDEGRGGILDVDGDGFDCPSDCDDDDFFTNPDALEVCNTNDDDCDGATDEDANDDSDPAPCLLDCNDENEHEFPGNPEVCDTFDNDCNPSTVPAADPCLDYGVDPCAYAFRQCDEELGIYGTCAHGTDATILPDQLCFDFMQCAGDPALTCGGEPTHDCVQTVEPGSGDVCPGATAPLSAPAGTTSGCQWAVIGGAMQQGWTVGIIPQGGTTPQPTASTCQATFAVVDVPAGLQPGTFLVALVVSGTYDHTEVFDIVPDPENVCPIPSLLCVNASGG